MTVNRLALDDADWFLHEPADELLLAIVLAPENRREHGDDFALMPVALLAVALLLARARIMGGEVPAIQYPKAD